MRQLVGISGSPDGFAVPIFRGRLRPSACLSRKLRGLAAVAVCVLALGRWDARAEGTAKREAPGEDPIASHWAFRPVQRPAIPGGAADSENPIDAFLAADLKAQGLQRSPQADRVTLIRRLYFVMLGLPPAPQEVDAFVRDPNPKAFETLVDRVLSDPRYGERWGRHWLDVIRFAESNGFETNRERPNGWRFRDYVIAAFNQDKPYDQFIREQLAGDALGADVATGFLVAGPVDIVGSPDPVLTAQQRADELDDMVSTTATAFLGITLGCVRCHSHKFDPIAHQEYYSMTALVSGVRHGERPLPPPPNQKARLAELDQTIADLERRLQPYLAKPTRPSGALRAAVNPRENQESFAPVEARFVRFTVLASNGGEPCLDELEVFAGDRNAALASAGTKATASGTLPGFSIHKLEHINDGKYGNSYSWISNEDGRGWVQLEFPKPQTIQRIVWARDREGTFKDRLATQYRIEVATEPNAWHAIASSDDRQPYQPGDGKPKAPEYKFDGLAADEAARARNWLSELDTARKEKAEAARTPMVYAGNFGQPSPAFRLNRGDPMQKREPVPPATLKLFKPVTLATNATEQERRLALASWIADPENPLTARVIVNRIWQHQFGVGLVETPNDFGKAGARPHHPELLDWLASDLVSHGWSLKALQRRILTSATWMQADTPRPEATKVDAGNRLLWRFAPRRLEAEAIRDSILAVCGNLDPKAGGPGFYLHRVDRENVYHYFPKEEFGPEDSRRMVYAVKVRMEQDGIFGSFDCPDGSLVTPKRSVSTTPLQALNLFNSRFMIQQAEILASRLRRTAGADPAKQADQAWNLAFNRLPDAKEAREAAAFIQTEGLTAFCRALLNANEFLFIP